MNIKAFFGDALGQALELGIGTPDDVLRHVTPDVLAEHLPRPLWARLFTACLGAPKVDARLVVDTIGVPNLCEHVPAAIIWACIADIGARSLGQAVAPPAPILTRASLTSAPTRPTPPPMTSVLAPPPPATDVAAAAGDKASGEKAAGDGKPLPAVNQPLADLITELESDERPMTPQRARTPTSQRFRQSNTGIGRLGSTNQPRRPMAQASTPPAPPAGTKPRRSGTEVEDAEVEAEGWRSREIAVDDSQLVDWQASETTQASVGDEDFSDLGRKR